MISGARACILKGQLILSIQLLGNFIYLGRKDSKLPLVASLRDNLLIDICEGMKNGSKRLQLVFMVDEKRIDSPHVKEIDKRILIEKDNVLVE